MSPELERVRQELEVAYGIPTDELTELLRLVIDGERDRQKKAQNWLADFERLVREDERAKLIRAHYKPDNSIKGGF